MSMSMASFENFTGLNAYLSVKYSMSLGMSSFLALRGGMVISNTFSLK